MSTIRPRKLRDTEIAACLESTDPQTRALARVVEDALARCADLERTQNAGTLDRTRALQMHDDLVAAQAEHGFHSAALLALVAAQEGEAAQ